MAKVTVFVLALVAFSLFSESFGYKSAPQPPKCPKNEEFIKCGRHCQTECATLGLNCNTKSDKCVNECFCIPGYARITHGGPCVPQDECPRIGCSTNEVWLECGQAPACQRFCDKVDTPCHIKPLGCPKGCYCKKGYARDLKTTKCIKIKYCKKNDKNNSDFDSESDSTFD